MKQDQQFIQTPINNLNTIFGQCNEQERGLFFLLSRDCTYKYMIFGVYKQSSNTTLCHDLRDFLSLPQKHKGFDEKQVGRALKKLEKLRLIKVLATATTDGELIIAVGVDKTLDEALSEVERDIGAFNIFAKRIREIEKNLNRKLNVKLSNVSVVYDANLSMTPRMPVVVTDAEQEEISSLFDNKDDIAEMYKNRHSRY